MKPNFFIVGAPKAGTTALSEYLRLHPNVFVSNPKEIHFFAQDFPRYRFVEDLEDYLALFSSAKREEKAVGEASVYYLYSSTAAQEIKRFNPKAKIIAMLREPIQLACSQHSEMVFNCNEDIEDFQKAWEHQDQRRLGLNVPKGCRDPKVIIYKDVASQGFQVDRLLSFFPKGQIHFVWLEDLKDDPRKTYLNVLEFLGVPDDGRINFPKVNTNKKSRWKWVAKVSQTPPLFIINTVRKMRLDFGISLKPLISFVRSWNSQMRDRPPLDEAFHQRLKHVFRKDIETLARATGRNLDHWLK